MIFVRRNSTVTPLQVDSHLNLVTSPGVTHTTRQTGLQRPNADQKKATNGWKQRNQTEEEGENIHAAGTRGLVVPRESRRS